MSARAQRYSVVAIVLHWAIAIAILAMIPLGWWMGDALEAPDTRAQAIAAFQLHKSIGLTVLALSVVRLGWRLMNPGPALPDTMKGWERAAARATHGLFYVLMIAMPLTGWLYVSTAWSVDDGRPLEVPTVYFGLFQAPHLFGLSALPEASRAAIASVLEFGHSKMAWGALVLTALHIGAALKHQLVDKDGVLGRMVPGAPDGASAPAGSARTFGLLAGFLAIGVAAAAALWAFSTPPARAPSGAEQSIGSEETTAEDALAPPPTADSLPAANGAHVTVAVWRVDRGASSITFSGTHAGVPFEGRFSRWRADIAFSADDLDHSTAVVTVETASASDGVPLHDNSLPQEEWFDVTRFPTAVFHAAAFRERGERAYEARGALTIKDRTFEVRLPFTLSISGDRAVMDGSATISREDANLGMRSDPDAEYVSEDIIVRVHVEAVRAQ
ncbi:MAG: cytochrome b/b6 domain-containing protein [Hyphomonadaceae bacterium]|nr:cytochrome b/b6 domain-containing protein [Hyphomonadaceae bacterium]